MLMCNTLKIVCIVCFHQYSAIIAWSPANFEQYRIIGLHFAADSMGLSSVNFFLVGFVKLFSAGVTFRPFRVIQGHWFWYQSKALLRLPISPSSIQCNQWLIDLYWSLVNFEQYRIIGLHFAADSMGLSSVNFSGGLRKTFLQEWRFGRSGSSKVIDFGTNWKRVCDFLLVRHSNLGLILHCFGNIASFCT